MTSPEQQFAYAPPTVQRRGLGAGSLVTSLITPALALVVLGPVYLAFTAGTMNPWTAFGIFILGLLVLGMSALVLGITAIVLGGLAVRRRRGRGLGIAGIVLGGLGIGVVVVLTILYAIAATPAYAF